MNLSARATAVAAAVCASAGLAAGTAAATPLTPAQVDAAEQAAAQQQVPFDLPLGAAAKQLTGSTAATTGVDGSVPAALLLPPSATPAQATSGAQDQQLVPDPLVPPLNTTQRTPGLGVSAPVAAPLSSPDGKAKPNAVDLSLPSAPLRTVGSAVSLGHPLTYHQGETRALAPVAAPAASVPALTPRQQGTIDLGRLDPSVSEPQLHTDPHGRVDLDQGGDHKPLTQGVDELLDSAGSFGQGLNQ